MEEEIAEEECRLVMCRWNTDCGSLVSLDGELENLMLADSVLEYKQVKRKNLCKERNCD
jgi:hypothetical protein